MNKRLLKTSASVATLLVSLAFGPAANAAAITATWQDGNIDDWNNIAANGTNWNFSSAPITAAFPNNDVNDTFAVQIDSGGAGNSTVNLNTDVTIDSLNVSANDTLNLNNGRDITLVNGTLTNNGAINMNSIGSTNDLTFTAGGSISGTGTLTLNNNFQNRVVINGVGNILTNGVGHTIQGGGQIGLNAGGIVNNGSIIQQGTAQLIIDPDSTGNFVNNNVLRAEGSGGLQLNGAQYTNNSTIEASNGSHVSLNGSTVSIVGGNLTTTGTGEIRSNASTVGVLLNGVTVTAGSNLIQNNGMDFRVQNGITNNANWEMNSSGSSTDVTFFGVVNRRHLLRGRQPTSPSSERKRSMAPVPSK